jgi:uncharacterized protein YdaU (DUF1376 family)
MSVYETRLPWYYMYAPNLMAEQRYRLMTLDERGLFLTLQNECWVNDALPATSSELSRLTGVEEGRLEAAFTERVRSFFKIANGQISSPELDGYKAKHRLQRDKQRQGGRKSGEVRRLRADSESRSELRSPLNQLNSTSLSSNSVSKKADRTEDHKAWIDEYDGATDEV